MENQINEIIETSRVTAFYWCDTLNSHVSELECGLNVIHGW